jgi:hypothetical protein
MAVRTDIDALKVLVHTEKDDEDLEVFVTSANVMVEENLLNAGLSSAMLTQIELYLAAHFLTLAEEMGGIVRDTYGDAASSFANVYGPGLKATRWGQQAIAFDVSGTLQALTTQKPRAQIRLESHVDDAGSEECG